MTVSRTLEPFEEQYDLALGGTVEIGTTGYAGTPVVHLHFDSPCMNLTAEDVITLVHSMMRGVDVIGFPEPTEPVDLMPSVTVTVLPANDLIYTGVRL